MHSMHPASYDGSTPMKKVKDRNPAKKPDAGHKSTDKAAIVQDKKKNPGTDKPKK